MHQLCGGHVGAEEGAGLGWKVQSLVFIKCPAGPGSAGSPGSAEMLQVKGLAWWWGRCQGKLRALLCL